MKRFLVLFLVLVLVFSSLPITVNAESCSHRWKLQYDPMYSYSYLNETYHVIDSLTLYYVCRDCEETKVEISYDGDTKDKHSFTGNICYTCGYEKEVHEHDWELEYDPVYNYEYYNEKYHVLTDIELYYICHECDETKVVTEDGENTKSKHSFTNNICYTCGYEKEVHEHDWEFEYDPVYSYEYYDETYHTLKNIKLYYICYECDETKIVTQDGEDTKSKHSFTNNICYTCGYEKEVHEHNWELEYDPVFNYEQYNETYHILKNVKFYYECSGCGEARVEIEDQGNTKKEHSFSDNVCYYCGYERIVEEHEHKWYMKYDPWYQYIQYDETYHRLEKITLTYACECGETKTDEQSGNGELDKHNFVNNVCGTCNYIKEITIEPTPTVKPVPTEKPFEPLPTEKPDEDVGEIPPAEEVHVCSYKTPYLVWVGSYTNCNKYTHTQQRVTFANCIGCGEKKIFSNVPETVNHTIEDGICKWCKIKVYASGSEKEIAQQQLEELKVLSNTLREVQTSSKISISQNTLDSLNSIVNNLIKEYQAVINGERLLDGLTSWQSNNELKLIWEIKEGRYQGIKLPNTDALKFERPEIVYINLEEPDNSWYYMVNDAGEQVLFGNFTEKVTITGILGQMLVGETPGFGTVADIRDVVADFVNWEWTWAHLGSTALDFLGFAPFIGCLKFADDAVILNKATKLSDEAGEVLTDVLKKVDNVGDTSKNSDEIGKAVAEALTKHVDEAGQTVVKNFDELSSLVKHPEYFGDNTLEHIFKGNNKGGFHYEGFQDAGTEIMEITKAPDANGVYQATVRVNGKPKGKLSTFFPKHWTPEDVIEAIEEAYSKVSWRTGIRQVKDVIVSSGVKVRIVVDETANIVSAYPIMQ